MSYHARMLADMYADTVTETDVELFCNCGEMSETPEVWRQGYRITARDLYVRVHSPLHCGALDHADDEWRRSRSN